MASAYYSQYLNYHNFSKVRGIKTKIKKLTNSNQLYPSLEPIKSWLLFRGELWSRDLLVNYYCLKFFQRVEKRNMIYFCARCVRLLKLTRNVFFSYKFALHFAALCWIIYCIALHPQHQRKCQEEVDAVLASKKKLEWYGA